MRGVPWLAAHPVVVEFRLPSAGSPGTAVVHSRVRIRLRWTGPAAYAARYVAKNVVAAGLAARAEVQVADAIGVVRPVPVLVETFGTERVARRLIEKLVAEHFGRTDVDLPWERTDRAAALRDAAGLTTTDSTSTTDSKSTTDSTSTMA